MAIKKHYSKEDDIFTIYDTEHQPSETIEFSEFLNIDINKDKGIVGLEIFYASEFFSALGKLITKDFLESAEKISLDCKNHRNNWFIILNITHNGQVERFQLPPLRKTEYTSPLIVSCQ